MRSCTERKHGPQKEKQLVKSLEVLRLLGLLAVRLMENANLY